MPKTLKKNCDNFIEKYGDLILNLITTVPPTEICLRLSLCATYELEVPDSVVECGVCHGTVDAISVILEDGQTDREIEDVVA